MVPSHEWIKHFISLQMARKKVWYPDKICPAPRQSKRASGKVAMRRKQSHTSWPSNCEAENTRIVRRKEPTVTIHRQQVPCQSVVLAEEESSGGYSDCGDNPHRTLNLLRKVAEKTKKSRILRLWLETELRT